MTKLSDIKIGIIGATGAVGVEALKLVEKINHPKNKISLFASERYTGKLVEYNKDKIQILEANEDNLKKIDVGLIAVSSEVSENLAPIIVNNVVLPAPFGPKSANTSPLFTSNEISSTAINSLYVFVNPSILITISCFNL